MSTKRSVVWDYFTKDSIVENKVKCNLCSFSLTVKRSTTSSMTRHLKLKHPTINISEPRKGLTEEDSENENVLNKKQNISVK